MKYLAGEGRNTFERPYGLAWLLQLIAELREWDEFETRQWSAWLRPPEQAARVQPVEFSLGLGHGLIQHALAVYGFVVLH